MWTSRNRARYDRSKLRYPSDVTDEEWELMVPLIPPGKSGGGKRTVIMREVVNGLMYVLSTGCQWRAIPKDLPPKSTVYDYFDLWTGADPVKTGLVDSFNRPGGNLTGLSGLVSILGPKRLELLRELLPSTSTIALLVNPNNPNVAADAPEAEAAANALGRRLEVLTASTERDLEAAFTTMVKRQAGALAVMPDPLFFTRRAQLIALAARYAVPTIYPAREFTENGGLMSYGANLSVEVAQQAGTYTGKILRGAKPADLPIQQSIKLELVINLKTAKALGLTIPPTLSARADQVIE